VLKKLIGDGFLGELLSVEMQRLQTNFADLRGDLHWRQDDALSGYNTLNIGASYESMMRWLGRGNRVMAMSKVHVPFRRNAHGDLTSVTIPDHVDILYELANGAQVHMRMSATTGLSTGNQLWMYGSEGTIYVDHQQNVFAGRRGDAKLSEVPNPPEQQAYYRVEEQFANAIRGTEQVTMVAFETGVHYMEWTEAVHRSSQTGQAVYLPL
jgi:predicted dehydrogenase